jgi:hypothetical protein
VKYQNRLIYSPILQENHVDALINLPSLSIISEFANENPAHETPLAVIGQCMKLCCRITKWRLGVVLTLVTRPKPMARKSTTMERGYRYFKFPSPSNPKSNQTFIHSLLPKPLDRTALVICFRVLCDRNKTNCILGSRARCHSIRFGVPKKGAERVCDFFIRPRVVSIST